MRRHLTCTELLICMLVISKCAEILLCPHLQQNFGYNSSPLHPMQLKQDGLRHHSIIGESSRDPEDIRKTSECRYDCLKKVTITGFCSAKSLVKLTSYIVENTPSLESLTLDTTLDKERNCPRMDRFFTMSKEALLEAHRSLEAIRRYIIGKVPSNICLEVIEPCKRCQSHIIHDVST